ncbi:hypothetical protein [Calderihabitans maritimus]|nr:hypothetical protein [Calderihabitans maritimus]
MNYRIKAKSYIFRLFIIIFVIAVLSAILLEGIEELGSFPNLLLLILAVLMMVFPYKNDIYYEISDEVIKCERRFIFYRKRFEVPLSSIIGLKYNDTKNNYNYYLNERANGTFHDFVPDGTFRYARNHWVIEFKFNDVKHYLAILPDDKMLNLIKEKIN